MSKGHRNVEESKMQTSKTEMKRNKSSLIATNTEFLTAAQRAQKSTLKLYGC